MISTLWRAQEIRKRLSTRSTTRRAAVIQRQGHLFIQALCNVSITYVQFLMCIKWIWMELKKKTVFLRQWPFDFLAGHGSKRTSRTKHRVVFFFTEWLFLEDEWMSMCTESGEDAVDNIPLHFQASAILVFFTNTLQNERHCSHNLYFVCTWKLKTSQGWHQNIFSENFRFGTT